MKEFKGIKEDLERIDYIDSKIKKYSRIGKLAANGELIDLAIKVNYNKIKESKEDILDADGSLKSSCDGGTSFGGFITLWGGDSKQQKQTKSIRVQSDDILFLEVIGTIIHRLQKEKKQIETKISNFLKQ